MNIIDTIQVIIYLIVTLIIGYRSGRYVKTINEFSVGGKTLPTAALVATIFATWAGGDDLIGTGEVYTVGIIFLAINLAQIINLAVQAYFIAPKILRDFSDKVSIGEIMGELYGNVGRIVTGIATIGMAIGSIAAQVSSLGYVGSLIPGVSYLGGIIAGSAIVILYSAYGGVRSVVSTDILQFGILIVAIPIMANFALYNVGGLEVLLTQVPDYHLSFFSSRENWWCHVALFCICAFNYFTPTLTQRILMAKDAKQAGHSLVIAGGLFIPFFVALTLIALCAVVTYPNCEPNMVFLTVLKNSLPAGIQGLAVIGVLAVIMSTADSHINVATVSIIRDIIVILFPSINSKKQLILARIGTVLFGISAVFIASSLNRVVEFWVYCADFWMPVVTAPMLLYIFNIKTNTKQYVFSAIIGAITVIVAQKSGVKELGMASPLIGMIITMFTMLTIYKVSKIRSSHQVHENCLGEL